MSLGAGFIGLGNHGKPIAANLLPAGFETTVHDLAPGPVAELVAAGAKAAASPREVGARSDVIGVCVPADAHVRAVVLGENGVLAGAARGASVWLAVGSLVSQRMARIYGVRDEGRR